MSEPRLNRRYVLRERPLDLPDDSHFSVESTPIPSPGEGEILVKTLLAALSPWQNQRLKDFKNYTRPFAIGELIDCDVLGEVTASNCPEIEPGQLVTGRLGWQEWSITTPEKVITIDDEFAPELWLTALSSPGLTAYAAMDLFGRPMPGQTLVVTSAAGSVGSYAVQLGRLANMNVVGICGSESKCSLLAQRFGLTHTLNHSDPDFAERLTAATAGGVHLFFDTVGGPIADRVFDNLAKFAKVLVVGRTASNNSDRPDLDPINMRQLWAREATIQGFSRYSYPERWEFAREQMIALCRLGLIQSYHQMIDGFEMTPTALRQMLQGAHTGKTLVRYAQRMK